MLRKKKSGCCSNFGQAVGKAIVDNNNNNNNDDDEDDQHDADTTEISFVVDEVADQSAVEAFRLQCKSLYVTLVKEPHRILEKPIINLSINLSVQDKGETIGITMFHLIKIKGFIFIFITVNLGSVFKLAPSDDQYWLVVKDKCLLPKWNAYTPKLINFIAENVFKRITSNFDLVAISKDLIQSTYMQYMSTESVSPQKMATFKQQNPNLKFLLAPATLKNEFELALFEYCIVYKLSFIVFLLPSSLDDVCLRLFPAAVVNAFYHFTNVYSNIIT